MWIEGEISLAYLTVDGATPDEHVEAAAAAGFDAAGLRILPPTHLRNYGSVVGSRRAVAMLSAACVKAGIRPLDAEVMSLTPETTAAELAAMVEAAAAIGFRFIQTVIEDPEMSRAADNLARLAEAGRRSGVGVAIEFMAFRPLSTLEQALRVMSLAGGGNMGLVIDALHLHRSGGGAAAIAALPPGAVAMVQLCDAPAVSPSPGELASEARERRLHPGEGGLPLHALLDALEDGLPLSLEVPHPSFPGMAYPERAERAMSAFNKFLAGRQRRTAGTD
jgi:sugar phosphate isomerase/epimerase